MKKSVPIENLPNQIEGLLLAPLSRYKYPPNLEGLCFGRLTVVRRATERDSIPKNHYYECICACGRRVFLKRNALISRNTKSCGCGKFAGPQKRVRNLTGQTFGRLLVIGRHSIKEGPGVLWDCLCVCGSYRVNSGSDLIAGKTKSCGCFRKDTLTTHGQTDRRITKEDRRFYAMKRHCSKKQRTPLWSDLDGIKMFYRNCPEGYQVDHIIPLQGQSVSGLHVLNNLQYLQIEDNRRKGNRFTPTIKAADVSEYLPGAFWE